MKTIRWIYTFLIVTNIACFCKPPEDKKPPTPSTFIHPDDQINTRDIVPKSAFDLNSVKITEDTLHIVTCSEYVYSPFGEIRGESDLVKGDLNAFKLKMRRDSIDSHSREFYILKKDSNSLIFYFDNDPESSKHSTLYKGAVLDASLKLEMGIKIGMRESDFFDLFLTKYPEKILEKFHVVLFESCVQDIRHFYTFSD